MGFSLRILLEDTVRLHFEIVPPDCPLMRTEKSEYIPTPAPISMPLLHAFVGRRFRLLVDFDGNVDGVAAHVGHSLEQSVVSDACAPTHVRVGCRSFLCKQVLAKR